MSGEGCIGCQRHERNPRNTLLFWEYDDDSATTGHWAHVDPSGQVYRCVNEALDYSVPNTSKN